jgi:hypothetical protein
MLRNTPQLAPATGLFIYIFASVAVYTTSAFSGASTAGSCTCDDFCSNRCAPFDSGKLPSPIAHGGRVRNVSCYRFTPKSISGVVADTNTGDVDGDLGFFLDRRALTARCALEPTNLRCFLAPWSEIVFARWELEVDTGWGPYLACNPAYRNENGTSWDLTHYICSQACVVPPFCSSVPRINNTRGGDGQTTCYCKRAKIAVGVEFEGNPPSSGTGGRVRVPMQNGSRASIRNVGLPQVCSFGTANLRIAKSCLDGAHIQQFEGVNLGDVASECCAACEPPECTGWKILQLHEQQSRPAVTTDRGRPTATRYQCVTLRGNLTRSVPGNVGVSCVGSAQRDPLPGGSWNWGTTAVSGGSWFSTPSAGQCLGTRRPGDGSGCTWRVRKRPSFIESTCVNNALDKAILHAKPDCFKDRRCHDNGDVAARVNTSSECFFRCYWLALHSSRDSADALWRDVLRPTFLHAWPRKGNATGQCVETAVFPPHAGRDIGMLGDEDV